MIFVTGLRRPRRYDQARSRMVAKELYFTPHNIARESQELLAQIEPGPRRGPPVFRWEGSALLVLDLQRCFLDPGSHAYIPSAPAILPGIQALVQAFARRDLPVVFSQHTNTHQDAGSMATWWRDLISAHQAQGQLIPEIDPGAGMVIQKSQYDAFFNTCLEAELRARQVHRVAITGVMTHLCCESTARSAFMRGFEVFFLVDGTATYNRAFHQASLLNLGHGFAHLISVAELLGVPGEEA